MSIEDKTSNLPWTVKYTPKTFDEFYGSPTTIKTLKSYLKKEFLPSLLFYGPPGTGKTSLSQLIYTSLYGTAMSSMVLKINTSEDIQIDTLQKRIVQFATTRNLFQNTKRKLVFVDDADNMSSEVQTLLSDMIDMLVKDVFFIFCSNNQTAFTPSFISRVLSVLLPPISVSDVTGVVKKILSSEGMSFFTGDLEDTRIHRLYTMMGGDLRKIINCIQAVYCRHVSGNEQEMALSKESMDTIFLLHQQEDLQLFINILCEKELVDGIQFLSDRMNNKSQDFRAWMGLVFEHVLTLSGLHSSSSFQELFMDYVTHLSEIEYNTSFLVDFRVQLYAFVTLSRQLLRSYRFEANA